MHAEPLVNLRTDSPSSVPIRVALGLRAQMMHACLGRFWEGRRDPASDVRRTFTIATTTANGFMSRIHAVFRSSWSRTPWPVWLGEETATRPHYCVRPRRMCSVPA